MVPSLSYDDPMAARSLERPRLRHALTASLAVEVWGFEPQPYGLQSHRSSQLSYTPNAPVPLTLRPRRDQTLRESDLRVSYGAASTEPLSPTTRPARRNVAGHAATRKNERGRGAGREACNTANRVVE
jgi:hypothetical protein